MKLSFPASEIVEQLVRVSDRNREEHSEGNLLKPAVDEQSILYVHLIVTVVISRIGHEVHLQRSGLPIDERSFVGHAGNSPQIRCQEQPNVGVCHQSLAGHEPTALETTDDANPSHHATEQANSFSYSC